jgi:hypothetical protein
VARAEVRVQAGFYEHGDFRAKLILDAELLMNALPDTKWPDPLTATVTEQGRADALPCEVKLVQPGATKPTASVPAAITPTKSTLEISFLVPGKLPVLAPVTQDIPIQLGRYLKTKPEENPALANTQIVSILKATADDAGPAGFDTGFGFGRSPPVRWSPPAAERRHRSNLKLDRRARVVAAVCGRRGGILRRFVRFIRRRLPPSSSSPTASHGNALAAEPVVTCSPL